MLWDLGWFIGQKIGRADEYVQYRKLFKEDDDFHPADRSLEERDNWLVGKEWYLKGIDAVDNKGRSLGRKTPRIFYSSPAKSQMNYAEAIEEEGYFDKARRAWMKASEEWAKFGKIVLEHSTGVKIRLGDQHRLDQEVAELKKKLQAMQPDAQSSSPRRRKQRSKPAEREALETPADKRTKEQQELSYHISQEARSFAITKLPSELARRIPTRRSGLALANELDRKEKELQYTVNYKPTAITTTGRIAPSSSKRPTVARRS